MPPHTWQNFLLGLYPKTDIQRDGCGLKKTSLSHNVSIFAYGCKKLWRISPLYFVSILLLGVSSGIVSPLSTVAWQKILDTLVIMIDTGELESSILSFLIVYSALNLLTFILTELIRYIKQTYSDMVEADLSIEILQKCSCYSMSVFDNPAIYDQLHIALNESGRACLALLDIVSGTLRATAQIIAFVIIVARFNWVIAIFCLISSLPLLHMNISISSYWHRVFVQRAEQIRFIQYLKLLLTKNENIKEAKLFKLGNRIIGYICDAYKEFLQNDKKARKRCFRKTGLTGVADEIVSLLLKTIIIYLGIKKGNSIGQISLYFNSQNNLKSSAILLIDQASNLHNCLLILQSMDSLMQIETEDNHTIKENKAFPENFKCIEFRNVSFCYPNTDKRVLNNLSFVLENGNTYFIVGLNGAGKTTIIKLLLRLYKPTSGEILIDGENIEVFDLDDYYNNVSAVFQDFLKLPFSLYENITCKDIYPQFSRFEEATEIAGINELIESLPYGKETHMLKEWSNGVDVSQGQWQRIAIARGCYCDTLITILDEPFSSIDAKSESEIIGKIRKRRSGKLTVYITHQLTNISLSDQILVLKDGILSEYGSHKELVAKKEIYYDLYNTQIRKLIKTERYIQ